MLKASRRIAAAVAFTLSLALGIVYITATASYAGSSVSHSVGSVLTLTSWPTILAGFVGLGSTQLTALLTHRNAPQWIKSGVHLALSTLGGVLINLTVVSHATWQDYLVEIVVAWGTGLMAHFAGLTALAQAATAGSGVGGRAQPLVKVPPDNAAF